MATGRSPNFSAWHSTPGHEALTPEIEITRTGVARQMSESGPNSADGPTGPMSEAGTTRTSRNVRFRAAIEGIADIKGGPSAHPDL